MQCISPLKSGFDRSGDLTYSSRKYSKELVSFAFPCRRCLACRLNIAREKAVRAVHEASQHKHNIFLTLTYDEQHVGDGRLNYLDFQLFIKRLRAKITENITDEDVKDELKISLMVTGEYGDKLKRPHWHAIIFNYKPTDLKKKYESHSGEIVYTSKTLTDLWGKGSTEFGSVTLESAGYVARYAAKKLVHGKDQEHDYHPIHKTSSKNAIGKSWIEKYYEQTFANGYIILNGKKASIPRYYLDWCKKNQMPTFTKFLAGIRQETIKLVEDTNTRDELEWISNTINYESGATYPLKKSGVKHTILKQKFKQLQERLKL